MSYADFVHLRVHTAYSLSEGAIRVKDLAERCRKETMPAVAMTDTGNLFGALEFSNIMAKAGIQPIIGCEIALGVEEAEGAGLRGGRKPKPDPLVLLAQDETGYQNLLALSSLGYLDTPPGEPAHVDYDTLARHAAGVIALTGGPRGALGRLIAEGQEPAAEVLLGRLMAMFPGRLYIEIQRHGLPAEARTEGAFLDLADRHNLPLIATNECYFADADMFEAHEALLCIADGMTMSNPARRRLTREHRFKSAGEMRALFADLPEALDNTLVVARRCAVMAEERKPILPRFGACDEAELLRGKAEAGLDLRLRAAGISGDRAVPYRERLDYELGVITKMGFPGYFLIVSDFIQWAKARGIPVGPGRGSGAGSVVAWALTITDLDPLRFGLLFERFLNPERISMPDFDIDFCQERRDEVIRYVQERYGEDQVAQIITFGTLQARAALRDVGRVLELPFGKVDRICKMVPNNPAHPVSLAQAIEGEPRLQEERDSDDSVARLIAIALKLEGLYRHASTHAAGVVIGDRPLKELVPLYRDPRAPLPATQFSMKYVEAAGLVKFDFLGLKTLTVIDRARRLLAERGIELDLANLALDDPATFAMLAHGDAVGVFQLESSGMRDVLRHLKPDTFEDIIALVALYRPGPMDNIPKYVACKHGAEQPDYLHPALEPILKETYGVIIYQEQVMQIAQVLAGYSLGEADILRKAMGKKIQAEMAAQRVRFVEGAERNGVPRERAEYIFELVAKFAGYGFNKSHAAAYALVAYQTAWLKANRPVEFFAALMSLDLANTEKLDFYRQELNRLEIALRPPDINLSGVAFTVEAEGENLVVRYALAAIRNVGEGAMAHLVEERAAHGPFRSLADFAARIDPQGMNKRQLENLVKAGAFDSLERNRRRVFEGAETILRYATAASNERRSSQSNLFGGAGASDAGLTLPEVPDWPGVERLTPEFEAIGFYLSAHPLAAYGAALQRLGVTAAADLSRSVGGNVMRVRLAGVVLRRQERVSSRGSRFAFVQASDASGMFEVTVFSEILSANRELLEPGQTVLFVVEARRDNDQLRLTAQAVHSLERAAAQAATGVRIVVDRPDPLPRLKETLSRSEQGRGLVTLRLRLPTRREEVDLQLPGGFAISPAVLAGLRDIPGVVGVHEI